MSVSPLKSLTPALLPVVVLLISMLSLQGGASLAKTLFPTVGATGITALRLGFGTVILCLIFKPWRLRFRPEQRMPLIIYGLALGTMNFLFYLSIRTVPLGIAVGLEFVGPLTLALLGSRRPLDFLWVILAVIGLWFLLPFSTGITSVDPIGALFALGAGVCWAVYILSGQRAGAEHGAATVAIGSLIASLIFVPVGLTFAASGIWQWSVVPVAILVAFLSTALPYSLEMMALTRLPARIFGTLMSLEPAVAALSGMLYLNESLSGVQCLALLAIILASSGATLTMRPRKRQLNAIELSDNKKK
ncbi:MULTISPECIES: threonine/homoserine exporter RhtA [Pantoea]|uniref:threonine/homoserine exporter RhtA n=1 Tax=Pantoea TaxID=53335 RepID=UPI00050EC706|nr:MULTISPECIES: threonine/homoserine exporter RhtA [Pantoea]KKW51579.1 threonine transporter [Pantoea ananatis]KGD85211.1 threonine transporter [Pantoea stewartii subsp. indologenes]MDF7784364.1 threonine/homoserine exporter RhtA [Pantoea stewartii]MEB6534756.1 threonine/homoserine exporter RhtA [Pantoea stewartii]NRH21945.1 threonine/homoserine exporter RhtA [Pantoea stewartii]